MARESAAAADGGRVGLEGGVVDTGVGIADEPTAVDVGPKPAKDKDWDKPGRAQTRDTELGKLLGSA